MTLQVIFCFCHIRHKKVSGTTANEVQTRNPNLERARFSSVKAFYVVVTIKILEIPEDPEVIASILSIPAFLEKIFLQFFQNSLYCYMVQACLLNV